MTKAVRCCALEQATSSSRGGSRISGKGVEILKVWGFALLILSKFS